MKFLLIFIIILFFITIGVILFMKLHPVFGGKTETFDSQNFKNNKFYNSSITSLHTGSGGYLGIIKSYIHSTEQRTPLKQIPTVKFNKNDFGLGDFVWFGHSTILMNIENKNIMIDPVFYQASPIFIGGKSFNYLHAPKISDLPDIDTVLISHDHYDHLDYKSILELDSKVSNYIVPLGVKSHLLKWGVNNNKIQELDWYENIVYDDIKIIFTPAQHFSGRGIFNGSSTLWGSWVIKTASKNIYFSGDSGYFDGFKTIGDKYGPFDIAFIENGAYNDAWNQIHMYPEQSVQAAIDLQAKNVMPIHWGKFDLSLHAWYEPIERFIKESNRLELKYFHPQIGERFQLSKLPKMNWWNKLK